MIYILPSHERAVIFTLGRFQSVKGPGLVILVPALQQMTRVDMRPVTIELPMEIASSGNETAKVSASVSYRVIDAAKALLQVADYRDAVKTLAQVTLKNVLDRRSMDGFVFERRGLEEGSLKAMNAVTAAWGILVDKVEMKR